MKEELTHCRATGLRQRLGRRLRRLGSRGTRYGSRLSVSLDRAIAGWTSDICAVSPLENGEGAWKPGHRERGTLWNCKLTVTLIADIKTTPASIRKYVEKSISDLGGPPDLLLIHSPYVPEEGKIGEFWTILEDLVKDGTLRGTSLGVSNFRPQDLEAVLKVATIKPAVQREWIVQLAR